jgi:hypothetical protein
VLQFPHCSWRGGAKQMTKTTNIPMQQKVSRRGRVCQAGPSAVRMPCAIAAASILAINRKR